MGGINTHNSDSHWPSLSLNRNQPYCRRWQCRVLKHRWDHMLLILLILWSNMGLFVLFVPYLFSSFLTSELGNLGPLIPGTFWNWQSHLSFSFYKHFHDFYTYKWVKPYTFFQPIPLRQQTFLLTWSTFTSESLQEKRRRPASYHWVQHSCSVLAKMLNEDNHTWGWLICVTEASIRSVS